MSPFWYCSKCEPYYILTINWTENNYPTFICVANLACLEGEYEDITTCAACDSGSRGKPSCETCTLINNTFSCLTCKEYFEENQSPNKNQFPCVPICTNNQALNPNTNQCGLCTELH
jgi:hypothetical protein